MPLSDLSLLCGSIDGRGGESQNHGVVLPTQICWPRQTHQTVRMETLLFDQVSFYFGFTPLCVPLTRATLYLAPWSITRPSSTKTKNRRNLTDLPLRREDGSVLAPLQQRIGATRSPHGTGADTCRRLSDSLCGRNPWRRPPRAASPAPEFNTGQLRVRRIICRFSSHTLAAASAACIPVLGIDCAGRKHQMGDKRHGRRLLGCCDPESELQRCDERNCQ